VAPHREVKMKEFGVAGQADQSDRLPRRQLIAGLDPDAALGHVAVLRAPAVRMLDQHAVAAFLAGDRGFSCGPYRNVIHVVSSADHASGRRGQHLHALSLYFQVSNPDVGAVVTIIAASAATVVADLVRGIVIDIVLEEAAHTRLALDRQCERDGFLGRRIDRGAETQRNQDDGLQARPSESIETTHAPVRGMCRMHGIGASSHPLKLASCDDFREADMSVSGR